MKTYRLFYMRYNREGVFMKKFRFLLAMLALALVFGLAFVGCDNGTSGDDEDDDVVDVDRDYLSLFTSERFGMFVEFTINGASPSRAFAATDFVLIIDGTAATISSWEGMQDGSNYKIWLYFSAPAVTVDTRYTVKLQYNGSVVTPFTREGTVTCKNW
jgi:hypothetical protein